VREEASEEEEEEEGRDAAADVMGTRGRAKEEGTGRDAAIAGGGAGREDEGDKEAVLESGTISPVRLRSRGFASST
jgi:hypothetical protein